MEEEKKTFTIEEHQKEIEKLKEELSKEFDKKANEAAAAARIQAKKDYEKQLEKATMTAEEKSKAEHQEALKELDELRQERKLSVRKDALIKAKLPVDVFIDNKKLLDAEDGKLDSVVAELSKSWDSKVKEIRQAGVGDTGTHGSGNGDEKGGNNSIINAARAEMGLKAK